MQKICVFCGSSDKIGEPYLEAASEMGRALAKRNLTLVYGAGGTGLMGALADAVLAGGAHVIGITPESFNTPQLIHPNLAELHVVKTMHERKALMVDISDAFIALPGGFGTLEELFEILCWAQVGLHNKPVGVLDSLGYFGPLHNLIEHAREEGFIYDEHRALLIQDADPDALLDRMTIYQPPDGLERWVNRPEEVQ
ncbi:MAG TPA: TIGR00730 family Rossman fold protein [Anaerolineae bacterium]|nr:TIGR00730 family Rossman fold protein [Anaerolineae bacterium]